MKICFICGSIAPGRDGVGDYTTSLVVALTQHGQKCCVISLAECSSEKHNFPFEHLRLTAGLDWNQKSNPVKDFLNQENPDVISLQYVPYAYDTRGLPFGFTDWLLDVFGERHYHLMFHELWIAAERGASLKNRILGMAQKRIIVRMTKHLNPFCAHTSNAVYQSLLMDAGIKAKLLPIFSNITENSGDFDPFSLITKSGLTVSSTQRDNWLLAGVFGTIHPTWNIDRAFQLLAKAAKAAGKKAGLLLLGRNGSVTDDLSHLQESYPLVHVARLGALSETEFRAVVDELDFAFSASPWALLEKSGSAMAILSRRCPLVFTDDRWRLLKGITPLPDSKTGLYLDEQGLEEKIAKGLEKPIPPPTVEMIAEQLYRDLETGLRKE